jgi:hypothetical protein
METASVNNTGSRDVRGTDGEATGGRICAPQAVPDAGASSQTAASNCSSAIPRRYRLAQGRIAPRPRAARWLPTKMRSPHDAFKAG